MLLMVIAFGMFLAVVFVEPVEDPWRVSGNVWTDSNKNGLFEEGEPLMNEVLVNLRECDSGEDELVQVTATDETGRYVFYVFNSGGMTSSNTAGWTTKK